MFFGLVLISRITIPRLESASPDHLEGKAGYNFSVVDLLGAASGSQEVNELKVRNDMCVVSTHVPTAAFSVGGRNKHKLNRQRSSTNRSSAGKYSSSFGCLTSSHDNFI